MYNRYIRNDQGGYTRIPEEEARRSPGHGESQPHSNPPPQNPPPPPNPPPYQESWRPSPPPPPDKGAGRFADGLTSFLRHILDQFHLDSVDTGDLLLLLLLFLLFREEADDELLFAMGLLLIL